MKSRLGTREILLFLFLTTWVFVIAMLPDRYEFGWGTALLCAVWALTGRYFKDMILYRLFGGITILALAVSFFGELFPETVRIIAIAIGLIALIVTPIVWWRMRHLRRPYQRQTVN